MQPINVFLFLVAFPSSSLVSLASGWVFLHFSQTSQSSLMFLSRSEYLLHKQNSRTFSLKIMMINTWKILISSSGLFPYAKNLLLCNVGKNYCICCDIKEVGMFLSNECTWTASCVKRKLCQEYYLFDQQRTDVKIKLKSYRKTSHLAMTNKIYCIV